MKRAAPSLPLLSSPLHHTPAPGVLTTTISPPNTGTTVEAQLNMVAAQSQRHRHAEARAEILHTILQVSAQLIQKAQAEGHLDGSIWSNAGRHSCSHDNCSPVVAHTTLSVCNQTSPCAIYLCRYRVLHACTDVVTSEALNNAVAQRPDRRPFASESSAPVVCLFAPCIEETTGSGGQVCILSGRALSHHTTEEKHITNNQTDGSEDDNDHDGHVSVTQREADTNTITTRDDNGTPHAPFLSKSSNISQQRGRGSGYRVNKSRRNTGHSSTTSGGANSRVIARYRRTKVPIGSETTRHFRQQGGHNKKRHRGRPFKKRRHTTTPTTTSTPNEWDARFQSTMAAASRDSKGKRIKIPIPPQLLWLEPPQPYLRSFAVGKKRAILSTALSREATLATTTNNRKGGKTSSSVLTDHNSSQCNGGGGDGDGSTNQKAWPQGRTVATSATLLAAATASPVVTATINHNNLQHVEMCHKILQRLFYSSYRTHLYYDKQRLLRIQAGNALKKRLDHWYSNQPENRLHGDSKMMVTSRNKNPTGTGYLNLLDAFFDYLCTRSDPHGRTPALVHNETFVRWATTVILLQRDLVCSSPYGLKNANSFNFVAHALTVLYCIRRGGSSRHGREIIPRCDYATRYLPPMRDLEHYGYEKRQITIGTTVLAAAYTSMDHAGEEIPYGTLQGHAECVNN